ncbi:MAG: hypothetical protein Q7S65_03215 [Nanoarchaeota archaeon]|nr:hypothetical protein [Nanoarchaeota archaeon]
MRKKGEVTLAVIVLIVIIIVFLGWMMKEGWKECQNNSDCKGTEYCGSDFSCHEFKVITLSPRDRSYDTAWIIGICIIIAAIIFKWDSFFKKKNAHEGHDEHGHDHHAHHGNTVRDDQASAEAREPQEGSGYRADRRGFYEEQTGDEENLNKGHDHH